jgi:hypothetical protein
MTEFRVNMTIGLGIDQHNVPLGEVAGKSGGIRRFLWEKNE